VYCTLTDYKKGTACSVFYTFLRTEDDSYRNNFKRKEVNGCVPAFYPVDIIGVKPITSVIRDLVNYLPKKVT